MDPIVQIFRASTIFSVEVILNDKLNCVKTVVDLGGYRVEANGGIGLPDPSFSIQPYSSLYGFLCWMPTTW
jgi:hypothetical protein